MAEVSINGSGYAEDQVGNNFYLYGPGTDFRLVDSWGNGITSVFHFPGQSIEVDTGGNNRIADQGQGTTITDFTSRNLKIWDFQDDPTGKINLYADKISINPDGHGGTMIDFTYGRFSSSLDLIGDNHLNTQQLLVIESP